MRLFFVLFVFFLTAYFVYSQSTDGKKHPITQQSIIDKHEEPQNHIGTRYVYQHTAVKGSSIRLMSNLKTQLGSVELIQQAGCRVGTSGSFYTPDLRPIGLFVEQGLTLQDPLPHDLFIGYLWSADDKTTQITREPPTVGVSWALQSGPIVWDDGKTVLNIASDEQARRILYGIDHTGHGHLLVLYDRQSDYSGPLLTELSDLIAEIGQREDIQFATVLNLDGGFHSFYHSESVDLPAFAVPGSMLCVDRHL